MAEKDKPAEGVRFRMGENGPQVTAEEGLANLLQGKKGHGYVAGDTRQSDQVDTVDDNGVARTSSFEQQYANTSGGVVTTTQSVASVKSADETPENKPGRGRRSGS
jgi:hypothetical protein